MKFSELKLFDRFVLADEYRHGDGTARSLIKNSSRTAYPWRGGVSRAIRANVEVSRIRTAGDPHRRVVKVSKARLSRKGLGSAKARPTTRGCCSVCRSPNHTRRAHG